MAKKKKKAKTNPTDPNLLARSVVEAAIGEPFSKKKDLQKEGKEV